MRIINLIPDIPEGWKEGDPAPWRKAMGYPWADLENRIPAEDTGKSYQDVLGELEAEHGPLATKDINSYGFLKNTATSVNGGLVYDVSALEPVAEITGMWCGGVRVYVYPVEGLKPKEDPPKLKSEPVSRKMSPGYCYNCESWCHGDCGNFQPDPEYAVKRDFEDGVREQNFWIREE